MEKCLGRLLDSFGEGDVGQSGDMFGTVSEYFWDSFVTVLEKFGISLGIVSGQFWDGVGTVLA